MFRGYSALTLDTKGRISIPKRYRGELDEICEGKLIVTLNRDACLSLFPMNEWEEVERRLSRVSRLNQKAKRLQRRYVAYATECETDAQGRIPLPSLLRKEAGIEKQIFLIGQLQMFEIWSEQNWATEFEQSDDDLGLESLEDLEAQLGNIPL